jgi:hypothetical protein
VSKTVHNRVSIKHIRLVSNPMLRGILFYSLRGARPSHAD